MDAPRAESGGAPGRDRDEPDSSLSQSPRSAKLLLGLRLLLLGSRRLGRSLLLGFGRRLLLRRRGLRRRFFSLAYFGRVLRKDRSLVHAPAAYLAVLRAT